MLKQQKTVIEQFLNEQRTKQEAFQKTIIQQLQEQQALLNKQLQEQQKQFKAQQDQLKSQFETLSQQVKASQKLLEASIQANQQALKKELTHEQAQKLREIESKTSELSTNLNNESKELTNHLTTQLDRINFFKADNTNAWRDVIVHRDYAHLPLLLEKQISPRGMSFISIAEDKAIAEYREMLRTKGAIFTPQELEQDLNQALLDFNQGLADKKYLKNLRENVLELMDLIVTGTLPQAMQQTYDGMMIAELLPDITTLKIPDDVQQVFLGKIRSLQTKKCQQWLSGNLDESTMRSLDSLIVRRFWEQLKTTEDKENPNYPFIQENVAQSFVERYQQGSFPQVFQNDITETLTTSLLECYKKRDIDKPLSAAIAEVAKHFYDEDSEKVSQMDLYYQKAIREVIQKWRSNELTPGAITAIDQAVLKIESVAKVPEEVRQQLDEAGIARLLDQIKNNSIDDPLMKLSFENQIQNIASCLKTEEEFEQALNLIIEDWHHQKLDPASSDYIELRTTQL